MGTPKGRPTELAQSLTIQIRTPAEKARQK